MEDLRNRILQHIRTKGPSLPIQISKQFGTNSIMAGAMLSTLLAQKHLKITNAKIGGSPLYYVAGQEGQLAGLLYPHLKEVHKKAFDLLKLRGVLGDAALDPVNRVALRELADFAKKLTIYSGEVFWKWYLMADDVAEQKIKELVGYQDEGALHAEQPMDENVEQPLVADAAASVVDEPLAAVVPVEQDPPLVEPMIAEPLVEQAPVEPKEVPLVEQRKHKKPEGARKAVKTKQKPMREKKIAKKEQQAVDAMFAAVDEYFSGKDIEVLEGNMVKRNQEYEFLVKIPSKIGKVKFFVQFKNKKTINEGDFGLAQVAAAGKRLPLLFLTNGNVTAKARQYAESNGIVVERIS